MTIQLFSILILGVILFVIMIAGFKTGLRLGITTAKGEMPLPMQNPVTKVKTVIKEHNNAKEQEQEAKEFEEMIDLDYDKALKKVKEGI